MVDDRNETAHSNGNIFYSTQEALDNKITEILRVVNEIQAHSKSVIENVYREFLINNYDSEERESPDEADQIREVLIHGNYMSQKDIDICLEFDVETLCDYDEHENMRELHKVLIENYKIEEVTS